VSGGQKNIMAEALDKPRVGLFVTCLVDLFRPSVGFAAVTLLERAGCTVEVPSAQTCCGQPAYTSGDRNTATDLARAVIAAFEGFDYVVVPSGSCAAHIREGFPELFAHDTAWSARARDLAARTHELTAFLVDVRGMDAVEARYDGTVAYHDSCAGLRRLGVKEQPRRLLRSVAGLILTELPNAEECCGFGGLFLTRHPEISRRMADDKTAAVLASGADTLLGGDLGCLMNLAGTLSRDGHAVAVRHVAEVLAGTANGTAPIGAAKAEDAR
jgi:L-lactate dehydrogenase complex protein LldE